MNKIELIRRVILGVMCGLVAVVLGYAVLYALNVVPGFGGAAVPYVVLDRDMEKDPIEVIEFFSYDCVHCANLDPLIADWVQDLPDDVEFRRVHVSFGVNTALLAKAHLTLQARGALADNHERIFSAIHERGRRFTEAEQIAELVDERGITKAAFLSTIGGNRIGALQRQSIELANEYRIDGVPILIVANKYAVSIGQGRKAAVATIDDLINQIRAGNEPGDPAEPIDEEEQNEEEAEVDDGADSVDSPDVTAIEATEDVPANEQQSQTESSTSEAQPDS